MITLVLDRDSVAAGDDFDGHVVRWELADDSTVREVILRLLENGYLPRVAGDVAWLLEVHHAARLDGAPEAARIMTGKGPIQDLALITVPYLASGSGSSIAVSQLGPIPLNAKIADVIVPAKSGEYVIVAKYLSHGYPIELGALSAQSKAQQ